MLVYSPTSRPIGAALTEWATRVMDVILHLGAHRTATTSFQDYMRRQAAFFGERDVGFWGPGRTRRGLFAGLWPGASDGHSDATARGVERVQQQLDLARQRGVKRLVVSDANMIGTVGDNLSQGALYPDARARMLRFAQAFGGQVSTILFSPRSLELFWCSAMAYGVSQGHKLPSRVKCHQIAMSPRGWRDVLCDLSAAMPDAQIKVLPFEHFAGRPHAVLSQGAGIDAPCDRDRVWLKRTPELPELRRGLNARGTDASALPFGMGRWNPFTNDEHAALRETYADDKMWLTAGADGLATLTEDRCEGRAGPTPPLAAQEEGRNDEHEERQLARPG